MNKTINILYKEIAYKTLYASIITGVIYSVELTNQKQKHNLSK